MGLRAAVAPATVLPTVFGESPPSEEIVLGAFGIGPRGRHVLRPMPAQPDVRFVAIVWESVKERIIGDGEALRVVNRAYREPGRP